MLQLDKKTFEEKVLKGEGLILVDFFGESCAPCESLMPHIEKLEAEYGEKIMFTKLNTSKARRVAIGQQIMGLPVIAIYKNGEKIKELIKDEATEENIKKMINEFI